MRRVLPLLAPMLVLGALLGGCAEAPQPSSMAVNTDDRDAAAFSTYLSARFAAGEHDLPEAAHFYSQSLAGDPGNASLLALSFFYSSTSGDFDAAGRYATRIVATTPDDRAARLALAVIGFKRHDYGDARQQLAASAKGPFTALTLSLFDAWAAAAQHDIPGMDKDMQSLMAQKGAEGMASFHAALLQDYLGRNDLAEADYKKALSVTSVTPRVLEAYGRFLEKTGRGADAESLYRSHINEPGLASVTEPGLKRIADKEKGEGLIRSPADGAAEALFGIAASLTDAQSSEVSILYLQMALYLRPDLGLAKILMADRFETLRKYDSAIALYHGFAPSSPYYRMAAVQAALDEQRLARSDAAIADLKKLVTADPRDTESWTALGDSYRAANRFGDAVSAYDQAEKTLGTPAKKDWTLYYARAMSKEQLHDLDGSEVDIQTGLKLSSDQPELLNYLGYSWVDRGRNISQALVMLEKARTLRPYDGYIVDSVGWAYYRLGRYDDAATTLEAAVLLVPGDSTINDHLGDALWKAGKHIDARFQWYHAITFSDSDDDKTAIERKLKSGLS